MLFFQFLETGVIGEIGQVVQSHVVLVDFKSENDNVTILHHSLMVITVLVIPKKCEIVMLNCHAVSFFFNTCVTYSKS